MTSFTTRGSPSYIGWPSWDICTWRAALQCNCSVTDNTISWRSLTKRSCVPAGFAGLAITNGDGFAELGAMYGGLQTGYGLFSMLGALRREIYRPALVSLVFLMGGLALGRLYSTMTGDEAVGMYTWGAMAFEFATAGLAAFALRTQEQPIPASP